MNQNQNQKKYSMSSPLESLKKGRRGPIGRSSMRPTPFRNPRDTGDLEIASTPPQEISPFASNNYRSSLYTNHSGFQVEDVDVLKTGHKSKHTTPRNSTNKAPTDGQLMGLMMERLASLESQLNTKNKDLAEKDKTIRVLKEKVKILERSKDSSSHIRDLETKCLLQQQQMHEMETFLADYGMVWVGSHTNPDSEVYHEDSNPEDSVDHVWRPHSSVADSEFRCDYDRVVANINELNILAGDGTHKIQHTTDGARLKAIDRVPLTLYANGILMFDGPFRPFTDPSTQACVGDFMDGFFPSELQSRYPDGIPIQISDLRDTYFKEKVRPTFDGVGQVLGGEMKPSRLVPSSLRTNQNSEIPAGAHVTSKPPGTVLSVDQFLNKLPQSVIKDGKIIDIRGSLADVMQDKQKPVDFTVLETKVVKEMKSKDSSVRPSSARDVTTLRIKSEQGNHTYIVKMRFHETVGEVWEHLNYLRPNYSQHYNIVSTFPSKVYDNKSATLEDCGLIPNATLHMKPKQR